MRRLAHHSPTQSQPMKSMQHPATRALLAALLMLTLLSAEAFAQELPVLTLQTATTLALQNHPSLKGAQAGIVAAQARADEVRSGMLPQIGASATYQRSTSNFAPRPGALPQQLQGSDGRGSFDTFNYFNVGVNASLTFDAMQTPFRWMAAKESTAAQRATERDVRINVLTAVRNAFWGAIAQKSLYTLATQTLTNAQQHAAQVERLVALGLRPEIDLAQIKTDRANAHAQQISAAGAYAIAKAQLRQAMGQTSSADFDVATEWQEETEYEKQNRATLNPAVINQALTQRANIAALTHQLSAQSHQINALYAAFAPTLTLSTGLSDAGTELGRLAWNWNFQAMLSWPLFQGLSTYSGLKSARATLTQIGAQKEALKQQVSTEIEQAWLSIQSAKAQIEAAGEAVKSAQERLRLAEGRYQNGLGNMIELSDAQLALSNAAANQIKAHYSLSLSRTLLLSWIDF